MNVEELFEDMRPVATVWKKRGNKIERGRISKFVVNLKALTDIEIDRGEEENQKTSGSKPSGGDRHDGPSVPKKGGEVQS
jgi:hypothetical protein